MNANNKVLDIFTDQNAGENSMQTEVWKSPESAEKRQKLEATVLKIQELVNQFQDDHDLCWKLLQIVERMRGKLIAPATAKPGRLERHKCCDCGASEGELHELGCGFERCPCCGDQLIGCDCYDELLKLDPPPVCKHPLILTKKQWQKWERFLAEKGRVPFVLYPTVCARCGVLWPELFQVPDEEWNRYVEIGERDKVLCKSCYDQIRAWIGDAVRFGPLAGRDGRMQQQMSRLLE